MSQVATLARAGRFGELAAGASDWSALERAEAAWELGQEEAARNAAIEARQALLRKGERRDLGLAYLWIARCEASFLDPAAAAIPLEKARGILAAEGSADERALLALVTAECGGTVPAADLAGDPYWRACALTERAARALEAGDRPAAGEAAVAAEHAAPDLRWRFHAILAVVEAGSDHGTHARGLLDGILAALPPGFQAPFLQRKDRARFRRWIDFPAMPTRSLPCVARVLRALHAGGDLDALARRAVDSMIECTAAESGLLVLLERDRVDLVLRRPADRGPAAGGSPVSLRLARDVAASGQSSWLADAAADTAWSAAQDPAEQGLRSLLCVPLRFREHSLGAVLLENRTRPGAFPRADREVAELLADQVAVALENARPRVRSEIVTPGPRPTTEPEDRDPTLLARYGSEVISLLTPVLAEGEDPQAALDRSLQAIVKVTGAERGFILLFEERDRIRFRSAFNLGDEEFSPDRFRLSFGVITRLVREGQPLRVNNAARDPQFQGHKSVQELGLNSFVAVPIPGKSGPAGLVYLDTTSPRKQFTPEDVKLLERFADFLQRTLGLAATSHQRSLQVVALQQALAAGLKDLQARYRFDALIGDSPTIRQVRTTLDHIARFSYPVLVLGETGTGKELVAKAIHGNSSRRDHPMVAVNCAALSRELLESELFGHVRGAFTGADRDRPGLFAAANHGTLFLDEVGEMPEELQRKLLRVLQEGEYLPVGATTPHKCDVRIVAATHRELDTEVAAGRFREDLYYRLRVFKVALPALRDRPEDIPLLATHLLDQALRESAAGKRSLGPEALKALQRHAWPGNVRELENALRHAVAFSTDVIRPEHLPAEVLQAPRAALAQKALDSFVPSGTGRPVDELWKMLVQKTLEEAGWNQSAAAKELGISRNTLARKMKAYGIRQPG